MNVQFEPFADEFVLAPGVRRVKRLYTPERAVLKCLKSEANFLGAPSLCVLCGFLAEHIRADGEPWLRCMPVHPAIEVHILSRWGELVFFSDSYAWWECNLLSVVETLERLRAVDLAGVTKRGEQYKGWCVKPP